MIIIGDVHGKINEYQKIISDVKQQTIQLGDFGFKDQHEWFLKNVDWTQHKVLFGNHDDYTYLRKPHSLGNYSIGSNYMTIRGADSIDKHLRAEGVSWWANEEMDYKEMSKCMDAYLHEKPDIVISHDCPQIVREDVFNIFDKSITSNGLQVMFQEHKPYLWIFGHHHKSVKKTILGTEFICLNELETFEVAVAEKRKENTRSNEPKNQPTK